MNKMYTSVIVIIKMNNGKFGLDEATRMIKVLKIEKPDSYFFTDTVA